MGLYSGNVLGITPNVANDNWALDAAALESAIIKEIGWGGEATVSTAMRTIVARASGGTVPVAGNVQKRHPHTPTNLVAFVTTWTAQPTLDAGALIPIQGWNSNGGIVLWQAGPGDEIFLIGAAHVSCRNAVGTATSDYGVCWLEP